MRYARVTGCASLSVRALRRALLVASVVVPTVARPVAAQDVPNREAALEVRKRFLMDLDTLQSKFVALSDAIPADK